MRNKAWFWWLAIAIWAILLFFIRRALELGGSPIILFLVMLGLFFLVLFVLRVTIFRLRIWWVRLKQVFTRHR